MQTRIQGTTMPVLDVQLDPNESVFSESGELSWMSASIQMSTHTQMGGGGGLFGVLKRMAYSASRILITPNYEGHQTFNASEVFGRAMAQGISLSYYPSHDRTGGALAVKYGWAILRDAATQIFREFWPDIAVHVLHRHP